MTKFCVFHVAPDSKPLLLTVKVPKKSNAESVISSLISSDKLTTNKNSKCIIFSDSTSDTKNGFANYVNQLYSSSTDTSLEMNIFGRALIVSYSNEMMNTHFPENGKEIVSAYQNYCNLTKSYSDRKKQEGPKRNKKPYDFFCKQFHSTEKGGLFHEVNVRARAKWSSMTDEEKKEYNDLAEEDRLRYEKENEEFLKKNPLPPKKNCSAYNMYCRETKVNTKKDEEGVKAWKDLTSDEKSYYQELADKDKLRYQSELEVFTEYCKKNCLDVEKLLQISSKNGTSRKRKSKVNEEKGQKKKKRGEGSAKKKAAEVCDEAVEVEGGLLAEVSQ